MGTKGETNHKETGELLNHLKKLLCGGEEGGQHSCDHFWHSYGHVFSVDVEKRGDAPLL